MELGHAVQDVQFPLNLLPIHRFHPHSTARAMLHEIADLQRSTFRALQVLCLPPDNVPLDLTDQDLFLCQPVIFRLAERTAPWLGRALTGVNSGLGQYIFVPTQIQISDQAA